MLRLLIQFILTFVLFGQASAQLPAGYRLETVPLPKGAVTILGLCHKPDGTLAVVSWEGEVWEYKDKAWTRFAEHLMEPNGIYYDVKEAAYYVAQKPELTRLIDVDKDGVCDRYECVTDAFGISGEYHEYHYRPVVDSLGRKYASLNLGARGDFTVPDGKPKGKGGGNMAYNAPWRGWVYRSDRLGHFQPLASGFRSPCGIGMSPADELFITDNQGDWVADSCLYHIREGNFYGHPASLPARPEFTKEKVLSMKAADFAKLRTPPSVWFPREVIANTPGSPVWDTTGGKFGPFEGQMFIGDQRQSNYFRSGVEKVDGDYQGWCIDFLRGTESGPVKMSFDPKGRLWSAQVGRGWFSVGGKRTALQYAEWDDETVPFAIHSASLTKNGFEVTFTQPIGKEVTPEVSSWHYHYHSTYGSPRVDEKKLAVAEMVVSKDRKTVRFEAPLTTGKVYAIQFPGQLGADGAMLDFDTIFYTLNKRRPAKEPRPGRSKGWSLVGSGWNRNDKRRPIPPVVAPLPTQDCELPVPDGATILDASQWSNPSWTVDEQGVMSRGDSHTSTKQAYGDARIHVEFRFEPSDDPEWTGQLYGNSGVFLMSGYELQVVNSYRNPTFADGMCGAIYGQHPPRVNASRQPGEWQTYEILMKAPVFSQDGSVAEPLRTTIFHNGILIQDDVWIYGEVGKAYQKHGKRPLKLQDHKGTEVSFRNLWIVPDIDYDASLDDFRATFTATDKKTADTFTPYHKADDVPQNVTDLWKNYDARKEALDVRVVKEWESEGVVTRYITFTVGTFEGTESRIAAYYSFPDNGKRNAAFVWSHGGGQRAERNRGVYFAKQGFATIDINWLGRPMEEGIDLNTDWGKVDPTQGPRFYTKALRKGWKRNLQPDDYSIDPIVSPRNANWFLLTVAARRAITFLERQPEVAADKIGFSGYSMGGMVTALTAIDPRLKAVVPMVGGTGFKYVDFPGGIQGSSIRVHFKDDLELYQNTIDASGYWPLVNCPVLFLSSSNDFHSTFERIYESMDLLEHPNWRVSTNIHQNHGPGPEQWVLLNKWFDQHLKGIEQDIPVTPPSTFLVDGNQARFTVTPEDQDRLIGTEIYYSYDPNSRTRFWNRADAVQSGKSWETSLTVHAKLPLYAFALCHYHLPEKVALQRGETSSFALNSLEHSIIPETVDLQLLRQLKKSRPVFEDFKNGMQDWSSRDGRTIKTYKFQSPDLDVSNTRKLRLTINPKGKSLSVRLNVESKFLGSGNDQGSFSFVKQVEGDAIQEIVIDREAFKPKNTDKAATLEWSKIATFEVTILDTATQTKLNLTSKQGHEILKRIDLADTP